MMMMTADMDMDNDFHEYLDLLYETQMMKDRKVLEMDHDMYRNLDDRNDMVLNDMKKV